MTDAVMIVWLQVEGHVSYVSLCAVVKFTGHLGTTPERLKLTLQTVAHRLPRPALLTHGRCAKRSHASKVVGFSFVDLVSKPNGGRLIVLAEGVKLYLLDFTKAVLAADTDLK